MNNDIYRRSSQLGGLSGGRRGTGNKKLIYTLAALVLFAIILFFILGRDNDDSAEGAGQIIEKKVQLPSEEEAKKLSYIQFLKKKLKILL